VSQISAPLKSGQDPPIHVFVNYINLIINEVPDGLSMRVSPRFSLAVIDPTNDLTEWSGSLRLESQQTFARTRAYIV